MKHAYKGNVKKHFGWPCSVLFLLLTLLINRAGAQVAPVPQNLADTSGPRLLPVASRPDTTIVPVIDTFSIESSDDLTAPVFYHADDSMVLEVPTKKMYLYGKESRITYSDNELTAPRIEYDQSSDLVTATLTRDSAGKVVKLPEFNQGEFKSQSDTIRFNMQTGKGMTKGTYTQQGEMFVYGEKIKKVSPDVFYAFRGRFTTCNLDTPHFAFVSRKIKFISKKIAFTGPVHPEFEGVPLPIMLPFGIYPLQQGRHSGLLAPAFTANDQMGLALEGLGYYKTFGDHWDAVFRGTFYSYGGWTASINPRYYKRYKYQGNFSYDMQNFRSNFKGDPDYVNNRTMNIRWSHSADAKSRPGVNFMANVNAGSSKFNSQVPNSPQRNFTNQMNSSIRYSKSWKDKPYNIAISANHNQNTLLQQINLNLPDVNFNLNTLYPFRRKEPIGPLKWYENLGIALNTNAKSLSSFSDSAGRIFEQIKDNLQWGASHNVPIVLSLPPLGPLQISPNVTYQERWYQRKRIQYWNADDTILDTRIREGFFTEREMSFGISAGTRIFGMFGFGKSSKVQAVRHEIRPSISASYKPDMNGHSYYETQIDSFGRTAIFSEYDGSLYGPFARGRFGGLSFSIDNNVSMKVRNKRDTANLKKISVLDGFSLGGSYNFLADSFQLSPLNLSARSNILNKVNVTASARLDPYQYDSLGRPVDKLIWRKNPFSLGRMMGGNISLQSSFRGGEKTTDNSSGNLDRYNQNVDGSGFPLDEYEREAAYISNNPGEFADFSIPWSIDFSYSLRFNKFFDVPERRFKTDISQDVSWNSSMNLTPRWKIGVTGFYNITRKEIGTISMYLSREMHCWQMAINVSPVGRFRFFNITISPKSGLLRDLKVNRTRYFYEL